MPARKIGGRIYEEIAVTTAPGTRLPVDIGENVNIEIGTVEVGASVEVSNDSSNPVPVTGPLTDTALRAAPVSITGTVDVSSGTVEVSSGVVTIANGPAEAIPVSGPLTDTQLRALAVPVSGPLTNTQLRAASVPVSGTVTVSNSGFQVTNPLGVPLAVSGPFLTDDLLRASAVPVSSETPPATPSTTRIAALATSQLLIAANGARRGLMVSNISLSKCYLSFSNPATINNSFMEMAPGSFLLLDQQLIMVNAIYGIWTSANGGVQVTEFV